MILLKLNQIIIYLKYSMTKNSAYGLILQESFKSHLKRIWKFGVKESAEYFKDLGLDWCKWEYKLNVGVSALPEMRH